MNIASITLSKNASSVVLFKDGVYIARVQLPGETEPSEIALHGVKTELEAEEICNRFKFLRAETPGPGRVCGKKEAPGIFGGEPELPAGLLAGCTA